MSTLERALAIALAAHAGQTDKGGAPYVTHPLRMMAGMPDGEAQIVALLHDVVEKSDWTLARLEAEGFADVVLAGVDALTRRDGENEAAFVERAKSDALGRIVKRADLLDNIARTEAFRTADAEARLQRYRASLAALEREDVLGG